MKKILLYALTIAMVISLAVPFASFAEEDVIEISTAAELAAIGTDEASLAGNYKLTADIETATGIVGDFTGIFDGDGHTISGLTTALFQEISGATVKNLTVSGNVVGAAAAKADRGAIAIQKIDTSATVENVVVEGTLTYDLNTIESYVGALVGECWPGSAGTDPDPVINITGCTNKATLEITDPHKFSVGGLVGYVGGFGVVNFTECVNEGDINVSYTNEAAGFEGTISGVVGRGSENNTNGDIVRIYMERCANVGDITINVLEGQNVTASANGVIGQMPAGYLKYCYNAGNLVNNGTGNSNGLIGWQHSKNAANKAFSLEYCYNLSETRVKYEFVPKINQVDWSAEVLLIQGNHYLTGANDVFGQVAAEHLDNGAPNVECADVDEMFESLAQYGYVKADGVDYPVLPFQIVEEEIEIEPSLAGDYYVADFFSGDVSYLLNFNNGVLTIVDKADDGVDMSGTYTYEGTFETGIKVYDANGELTGITISQMPGGTTFSPNGMGFNLLTAGQPPVTPELTIGDNAVVTKVEGYYAAPIKATFTATKAGKYTITAAAGEENAWVAIEDPYGMETVELPYEFELEAGETVTFFISTSADVFQNDGNFEDEINLVITGEGDNAQTGDNGVMIALVALVAVLGMGITVVTTKRVSVR